MKVCIFGGSFNPVHNEHVKMAVSVIKELGLDKLIIMPTFVAPHKQGSVVVSGFHRKNMLELAFSSFDRVSVESFDGLLVDFLKSKKTANNIRGIRNDEDLKYEEGMCAKNKELYPEIKNHYIYADDNMKSVSSTRVKQLKNDGFEEWKDLLPEEVLKFLLSRL